MQTERRQLEKELNKMNPETVIPDELQRAVDRLDEVHDAIKEVKEEIANKELIVPEIKIQEREVVFPEKMQVEVTNQLQIPEAKAPIVNVAAPIVNLPAPIVNVPAPIVNVPEFKLPEQIDVNVLNFPKKDDIQKVMLVDDKGKYKDNTPIIYPSAGGQGGGYPSPFQYGGRIPDSIKITSIASVVSISGSVSVPNLEVAQNSSLSGQVGPLMQGSVSTAAPTYLTGTVNPLSLTTGGSLRTTVTAITGGTGATSLGKGEDNAHASGDTGVAMWGVRNDSDATRTDTDGDYSPISTDSAGRIKSVNPNLELAQGSTTSGQLGPLVQGAVTTSQPSYTTGQTSPLSLTPAGLLRTTIGSLTPGTSATNLGKAEDAASASGDVGVAPMMMRNDGGASAVVQTSADGDYGIPNLDAYGNQAVKGAIVPTYMAVTDLFTPAASATDIFHIGGSSTKTIKVIRLILSGTQTTLGGSGLHLLVKRTTANSGGTAVAATAVPTDSGFPAATALVEHYTANPTIAGSGFASVYGPRVTIPAVSSVLNFPIIFDFNTTAMLNGHPIVLRGTSQELCVNLSGTTPTGASNYSITIFWTEE